MAKAVAITIKQPETSQAYVAVAGNADPPERPDFADSSGGWWIASLLSPQKAVFAPLVRKIFETRGRFGKSNFFRFTHCKSVFSSVLNNSISAFFACIFFIYTRSRSTHEAIIDETTWERVQELRKQRQQPNRYGEVGMFSGLLFCTNCGSVMYQQRYETDKRQQDCYICGSYKKHTADCIAHFIRTDLLTAGVTENWRKVTSYTAKH